MEQKTFPGKIDPQDMARSLVMRFNSGETHAQWMVGTEGRTVVQIQMQRKDPDDPDTAVTLQITPGSTGVTIALSEQPWLGVAADLAKTGVMAFLNPWNLVGELDDIARNVRRLQLRNDVWSAVEGYCRNAAMGQGAVVAATDVECPYCGTTAPIGQPNCKACLGSLTSVQPVKCPRCGFVNPPHRQRCGRCGIPFSRL